MNPRPFICALVACMTLSFGRQSAAQESRHVDGPRLHLGDVVNGAPVEYADLDLGPSPPPGNSRLISKAELSRALALAGLEAKAVKLPSAVRVIRSARRLSAADVASGSRPLVEARLSRGARLVELRARSGVLVANTAAVISIRLPKLPARVGQVVLTATAEIGEDGAIAARVPLRVVLELGPDASRPDVARGARIDLVIEHGVASVSASAICLGDANIGDVASFKVEATKKILRARVEGTQRARVVSR